MWIHRTGRCLKINGLMEINVVAAKSLTQRNGPFLDSILFDITLSSGKASLIDGCSAHPESLCLDGVAR